VGSRLAGVIAGLLLEHGKVVASNTSISIWARRRRVQIK